MVTASKLTADQTLSGHKIFSWTWKLMSAIATNENNVSSCFGFVMADTFACSRERSLKFQRKIMSGGSKSHVSMQIVYFVFSQ